MGVHEKIKDIQCSQCNYKCASKGNLDTHTNTKHKKIRNFFCPDCSYNCYAKANYQKHLQSKHSKTTDEITALCSNIVKNESNKYSIIPVISENDNQDDEEEELL